MADLSPSGYLHAARVPDALHDQEFGPWRIHRVELPDSIVRFRAGVRSFVCLSQRAKVDISNMHLSDPRDVVMEDSFFELRKHLPIWLTAHGRVLKTGLGLGCVVRGLLANPAVTHIDVIEIDADIIRVVGAEFMGNPRVTIHHADALQFDTTGHRWDFAWHDIWCPGNEGLQVLHAELMKRFQGAAAQQGAWQFPRFVKRACSRMGRPLIGGPKIKSQADLVKNP